MKRSFRVMAAMVGPALVAAGCAGNLPTKLPQTSANPSPSPSPSLQVQTQALTFPDGTATTPETCGACHQQIFSEYATENGSDFQYRPMLADTSTDSFLQQAMNGTGYPSAHAMAGTDPWPLAAKTREEGGKNCNVCHFPQPLTIPSIDLATTSKPVPRTQKPELGVTCASCHLTPDGKIRGPYDVKAPHATVADPAMQTSAFCANCHSNGPDVRGRQTNTFYEWREDYHKKLGRPGDCQTCHMPQTTRKLAENFDVPQRGVGQHLWTGGHSQARIKSALTLEVNQISNSFELLVANVGAGHSVPTGSNRRAVYLDAVLLDNSGNRVASKHWMFAPWMSGRPDDSAWLASDSVDPDKIALSQADAQGPHEASIRAGEVRRLTWSPTATASGLTLQTTLTYDLNRYNDINFTGDQTVLASSSLVVQ